MVLQLDLPAAAGIRLPAWVSGPLASLPALSIRQPWAWAIMSAGKDIENRCWFTRFRGHVLIHAAKGCTQKEYLDACAFMAGFCRDINVPPLEMLLRGGIVGVANIVDCVGDSDSDWFLGEWGFVLRDVEPLEFLPCRGSLGFFRLPNEVTNPKPAWPQSTNGNV